MGLKPGYKQTEVGLIPEDWKVLTLGAICTFENGDRGENYPSPGEFTQTGLPFVNAGHLMYGQICLTEMSFISPEHFERLGSGKFRAGDILFCLRGSLGKFGIVGTEIGTGAIASSLIIMRPKSSIMSYRYLLSYIGSHYCTQAIEKWAGGAAQPNLGAQDLARFIVPYPASSTEQDKIAEALSDADALIESLEQLLAKKRHLKQGAMQELLRPRNGWNQRKLLGIAPLQRGFDLPNRQLEAGPYPVVYSNGILNHHKTFMVRGPGLVTGRSGTLGVVQFIEEDYWPHNTTLWVTDFKGNDPKFVYYLYTHIGLDKFGTGSGVPTLNRNDVHDYSVSIPSDLEEQVFIATTLSDVDAEITMLETKLTKARQLKTGMMQELLTGRIRLV
jgi:type I restriction enzyme S subunit